DPLLARLAQQRGDGGPDAAGRLELPRGVEPVGAARRADGEELARPAKTLDPERIDAEPRGDPRGRQRPAEVGVHQAILGASRPRGDRSLRAASTIQPPTASASIAATRIAMYRGLISSILLRA